MNYQIVHAIDGRIRIRMPQLAEESFGQQLKSQIEQLKAVTSVRINSQAVSIVITYRDRLITDLAMQEELHQIIEQLLPAEPPPTVADVSEVPEASAPTWTEPVTPPAVANTANLDLNQSVDLNEDVWADPAETAKQAPKSEPRHQVLDQEKRAEITNETLSLFPEHFDRSPHSTTLLAKRLGVSIQAINLRRSKPDFATWSQTNDPDGIAWRYQEELKVFVPVQTSSNRD
jgi:Heavy metal associated domain 2